MSSDSKDDIQLKSVKSIDDAQNKEDDPPPAYGVVNQSYVPENSQENLNWTPQPGQSDVVEVETIVIEPVSNGVRHRRPQDAVISDEPEQYEESSDEEDVYKNQVVQQIYNGRKLIVVNVVKHKREAWFGFWTLIGVLYLAFFLYAMIGFFDTYEEGDVRFLWVTLVTVTFVGLYQFWTRILSDKINLDQMFENESPLAKRVRTILYWCLVGAVSLFIVIFVIADVAVQRPRNLISAFGIFVFVALFYIFSYNPAKVKFQPVFWGLALQFIFALLILRTHAGYTAFLWLGERVREFLDHTDAGSQFVFGDAYTNHYFAFKVLTVIIFFSSIITVLYYLGVMQFIIRVLARFLAFCLGTSPTESLNAAGNIFIGQSESPLMIRPFIKDMTKSEIHAVCTGGFATIAGGVLAAYISMGVPPNHLLSASVMSAPAALAMAKLFWPETKKSKANAKDVYKMPKGTEHNIIQAASNGASVSIGLIANIAVNLIAFIAILHFINATIMWLGFRVDRYDRPITFQLICSYLFYPLAWLMGSDSDDCLQVAGLVATKTFLNEFVAYGELGVLIQNTAVFHEWEANVTGLYNGTIHTGNDIILNNGTTLVGGILTARSTVIATYALCGFSNIGSIGIMIGALGAMAPNRKNDITKVVVRAMIAGNVACFMTACIAGLLYEGDV